MERVLGRHAGGILGLLDLHEQHPEAVEADLIAAGIRWRDLGTTRAHWRDAFVVIATASPARSALGRAGNPGGWGVESHLLAAVVDLLALHAWQNGGGKGERPKPIPRPGTPTETRPTIGTAMPLNDFAAWWKAKHPN